MNASPSVAAVVKAHIAETYLGDHPTDLDDDTPLLELNIIDSFGLFEVVNFLHSRFGVKIPLSAINPGNFKSVRTIVEFVAGLEKAGNEAVD